MPKRKAPDQFSKELKSINPRIRLLTDYFNSSTKVKSQCLVCGNTWNANPSDLLRGHGCPECYRKRSSISRRKTHEVFVAQMAEINPSIVVKGKYQTCKDTILCKCTICGNIWSPKANDLLQGTGCPECNHVGTSFVEQTILLAFRKQLPEAEVLSRNRSTIGKELDILIPQYRVAIEYGAYYWHRNKLKNDEEKERRCQEKGIRLIRIYVKCKELQSKKNVLIYKDDISANHNEIKNLIRRLFKMVGVNKTISEAEYETISIEAYKLSRKQTTEDFKKRLKSINPNIRVLDDYKASHQPIRCQCTSCGRVWNPTPHSLLTGYQCRKCYLKGRYLTEEDYIKKVAARNPNIKIISGYNGENNRIQCKCLICGRQWNPLAKNLIKYGCAECSRQKKTGKTKLSHKEFVKKVKENNPSVKILGEYKGSHKPILCRCRKCGNEWSATAYNIQKGHGCKKCFGQRHSLKMKEYYSEGRLGINKST